MDIVFCGSPEFVLPTLDALNEEEAINLKAIITQADKPAFRGKELTPTAVKKYALKNNIDVYTPINSKEMISVINNIKPFDILITFAYGMILKQEVLNAPNIMPINIHTSILPAYRGCSPIQYALLNNEEETGVTFIKMDSLMDHGDILGINKVKIANHDTSLDILEKLSKSAATNIVDLVLNIKDIKLIPQNHQEATFTKKIKKEMGEVSFKLETAQEIYNKYRAFQPWPGIYANYKDVSLKINKLSILASSEQKEIIEMTGSDIFKDLVIGSVINYQNQIIVKTKEGFLNLIALQLPGKKSLSAKDFLNGNKDFLNTILD